MAFNLSLPWIQVGPLVAMFYSGLHMKFKKADFSTKSPNLTMLFYYIKMWTFSSPFYPFLQLTGALKWGTVWTSTSTGIETMHGQS